MKKTLNINLNGRVFNIDEDAYRLLENYLNNLKNYFSKEEGGAEIEADIETRIGELFANKIDSGYGVIEIADVEKTIAQIGNPSDFDETAEEKSAYQSFNTTQTQNQQQSSQTKKRFFRDTDNKMLGGVCAGIAAYFGWDVTVVRVVVVLLTLFSRLSLVVAYLIVWLAAPEAHTAEQKLQMRGEPVNLENIGKTVAAQANNFAAQTNNAINQVQNRGCASTFLKVCLIILGIIVGMPILTVSIGIVIAAIAGVFGVGTGVLGGLLPWSPDTFLFVQHPSIATVGFSLLIGIPLVALLYWICQKLFHWEKVHTSIKVIWLIVWFASIIMLLFAGWKADWSKFKNGSDWNIGFGNFGFNTINGNGNITTQTLDLTQTLTSLDISGGLNINVKNDSTLSQTAKITTDANILQKIGMEFQNGNLILKNKNNATLHPSQNITLAINPKNLENIKVSDDVNLNFMQKLSVKNLKFRLHDASKLQISEIQADNLNFVVSDASNVNIAGQARFANYEVSDASKISNENLVTDSVRLAVTDASKVAVYAVKYIGGKVSGVSHASIKGNPARYELETESVSSIEK